MAMASATPYADNLHLALDRLPRQHLITHSIFTRRMLFLTATQQCQSAEGSLSANREDNTARWGQYCWVHVDENNVTSPHANSTLHQLDRPCVGQSRRLLHHRRRSGWGGGAQPPNDGAPCILGPQL